MKPKELEFEYKVERPTVLVMPNDDQWYEVTLTVTATAVPSEPMTRDHPGAPAEIVDIIIKGPDGEEFAVTDREMQGIKEAAWEAAAGAWEDGREYEREDD